ncbi:hypothetical protein CVT26_007175 [Gymnopilus dilepis]|uniref:Uncharacterized protein n=1 Tax=Gymnopilus dilepis TaxID=231916 RepID=A0A409W0A8_9AGAR|nr:hypothetical protein CVT26_007175 [Gymnopilus dilepis]
MGGKLAFRIEVEVEEDSTIYMAIDARRVLSSRRQQIKRTMITLAPKTMDVDRTLEKKATRRRMLPTNNTLSHNPLRSPPPLILQQEPFVDELETTAMVESKPSRQSALNGVYPDTASQTPTGYETRCPIEECRQGARHSELATSCLGAVF